MRRRAAVSLSQLQQAAKQASATASEASYAAADAAHAAESAAARSASGSAAGFSGCVTGKAPLINHTNTTPRLTALRSLHHILLPSADASPAARRAAAAVRGFSSRNSRLPHEAVLASPGQATLLVMRPLAAAAALAVPAPHCSGALHGNSMTAQFGARGYASQPIGRITPELFTEKAWEVRFVAPA